MGLHEQAKPQQAPRPPWLGRRASGIQGRLVAGRVHSGRPLNNPGSCLVRAARKSAGRRGPPTCCATRMAGFSEAGRRMTVPPLASSASAGWDSSSDALHSAAPAAAAARRAASSRRAWAAGRTDDDAAICVRWGGGWWPVKTRRAFLGLFCDARASAVVALAGAACHASHAARAGCVLEPAACQGIPRAHNLTLLERGERVAAGAWLPLRRAWTHNTNSGRGTCGGRRSAAAGVPRRTASYVGEVHTAWI